MDDNMIYLFQVKPLGYDSFRTIYIDRDFRSFEEVVTAMIDEGRLWYVPTKEMWKKPVAREMKARFIEDWRAHKSAEDITSHLFAGYTKIKIEITKYRELEKDWKPEKF